MIDQRIAESFARQSMMTSLQARLIEAGAGRCVIQAPVLAGFQQQHGAAHAGVAFALGDSAAGYAALSLLPEGQEVMTVEMKINLLSPAIGEALHAVGEVVRAGRRLSVVRAEVVAITGETRKTIALLQGTMIGVQ
ncbi:PaaI family thioesterase [Roseinatronobacter sp.]|uniref:PaaI family thioesterase n=1 Tax=Roseinatronobacter sp. TaxID=1945755 RepID=UPI0025FFE8EA|nr:PaaI family thioesterase [Rhodobaca sp.]